MGCHEITVDDKYRDENEGQFDIDEETQLLRSLEEFWIPDNVYGLDVHFYNYEQIKTHDMSTGPYVTVYYSGERHSPYGLGFTAKRTEMDMTVEFRTLHRNQLFKMKEEVYRVLDYMRKRPFMDYDVVINTGGRRVEPSPGNFFYTVDVKLIRYVKPIFQTRWE